MELITQQGGELIYVDTDSVIYNVAKDAPPLTKEVVVTSANESNALLTEDGSLLELGKFKPVYPSEKLVGVYVQSQKRYVLETTCGPYFKLAGLSLPGYWGRSHNARRVIFVLRETAATEGTPDFSVIPQNF